MPSPLFKKRKSHFGQPAHKPKFATDQGGSPSGGSLTNPLTLTYFPHLDVFYSQTMDV